ncbi:MAG: hypothetical protein ABL977_12100 [Candidatus Eisenbacteria bacterium]
MSEVRGHALASSRRATPFRAVMILAGLLSVLVLPGCDKAGRPVAPVTTPPVADSPEAAAHAFEWAFMHRDLGQLEQLLADDFEFVTAAGDSAGGATLERWDRQRVLQSARNLFLGDPTGPDAAERIRLILDPRLVSAPDPPFDPVTHRAVRSTLQFQVLAAEGDIFETSGALTFRLSRGDVSSIPAGATGVPLPNSSQRWWIRGIVDETAAIPVGPRLAANPTRQTTLGVILTRYWNPR